MKSRSKTAQAASLCVCSTVCKRPSSAVRELGEFRERDRAKIEQVLALEIPSRPFAKGGGKTRNDSGRACDTVNVSSVVFRNEQSRKPFQPIVAAKAALRRMTTRSTGTPPSGHKLFLFSRLRIWRPHRVPLGCGLLSGSPTVAISGVILGARPRLRLLRPG